ncbi:MAG: AIR synthase-related protein [Armatimonadota bacterium]
MKTGKLHSDILEKLLQDIKISDDVIIGPWVGVDSAVVRVSNDIVIVASDPITFTTDNIGYYSVCVNINDIAVAGALPRFFLATVLLPPSSSESDAQNVINQIKIECEKWNISLIGGHTEFTESVNSLIVNGCMIGFPIGEKIYSSAGVNVGDDLVLVGSIAYEGCSIIATHYEEKLIEIGVDKKIIHTAQNYIKNPGICILKYAIQAVKSANISAMHDPTEGGIANAIYEMAKASNVGFIIDKYAIEITKEADIICKNMNIDPLGLISSGCLLVSVDSSDTQKLIKSYNSNDITAGVIGRAVDVSLGVKYSNGEKVAEFERDEIARIFEEIQV